MDITINFTPFIEFFNLPPNMLLRNFLLYYGWFPIAITYLIGSKMLWMHHIQNQWYATQEFMLLAIDIPRGNEQSPRAVENMFAYMAGAHGTQNLIEKYWLGLVQLSFSLEIVSMEGYTQFIIRTPVKFKNLVESAVYSQYPDAEITEIQDYTQGFPKSFPDDEYDAWGAEFIQVANHMFPIKIYEEFEHKFGESEVQFKDPMASLMDLCSSLNRGEFFWYQIIIRPTGFDWVAEGDKEIGKILKEKVSKETWADKFVSNTMKVIGDFSEFVYSLWGDVPDAKEKKTEDALKMMNLKPKEKKQVEGITQKISKIGYDSKIRIVYICKKDVKNTPKVANGFVGYIKQFTAVDLNSFKPDMDLTGTSTHYFFKQSRLEQRKSKIVKRYMSRDGTAGRPMKVLNIEELATIWHFPLEAVVKAPLMQKVTGRKSEAPMNLPIGENIVNEQLVEPEFLRDTEEGQEIFEDKKSEDRQHKKSNVVDISEFESDINSKGGPPTNLPF